jgi:hypothetical protein
MVDTPVYYSGRRRSGHNEGEMDRYPVTFSLFSKFANSPNKLESYCTNVLDFQICHMVPFSQAKYQFMQNYFQKNRNFYY